MNHLILLVIACQLFAAMPRSTSAADDDAGPVAADDMQRWLDHQARHLVLGWNDGRLELDLVAMRAGALGPQFDRHHAAVQATLAKAPAILVEEAVANGLPRPIAEKLFADVAQALAWNDQDGDADWIERLLWPHAGGLQIGLGNLDAKQLKEPGLLLAPDLAKEPGNPILYLALAMKSAEHNGVWPPNGGMGGSNGAWEIKRGDLKLTVTAENQPLAYEVSRSREPRRSFALADADGPALSIRWEADGGPAGETDDALRIQQTAEGFRATRVRDGENAMKLEGATFRDCCRAQPDVVRRELMPLLRSIGLGTPAMPEDDAVKAAVVARLRRDAGLPAAADDAKRGLTAGELANAKHRLAQTSAAIDTFRLLDDAAYLAALKQTATGDDAAAIDARLAALGKR